jgi:hypothetical protein
MPKEAGNISVADQPVGLKEDLSWKTNRGLSCKKAQTILKGDSSRLIPHGLWEWQPVDIHPVSWPERIDDPGMPYAKHRKMDHIFGK